MDSWIDFEIHEMFYAPTYNKAEERAKRRESIRQYRARGGKALSRDKAREHSASKIYANVFTLLAIMLFASAIVLSVITSFSFFYYILLWLSVVVLAAIALLFHAKATLVKRVGLIPARFTAHSYQIKNIIN